MLAGRLRPAQGGRSLGCPTTLPTRLAVPWARGGGIVADDAADPVGIRGPGGWLVFRGCRRGGPNALLLGLGRDRFCWRGPGSGYRQCSQHTEQKTDDRADEDAGCSTWSSSRNRLGWPCQARQLDALLKRHLQAGCQCLLLEQCPLLAVLGDLTSEGLDLDEALCCRRARVRRELLENALIHLQPCSHIAKFGRNDGEVR